MHMLMVERGGGLLAFFELFLADKIKKYVSIQLPLKSG